MSQDKRCFADCAPDCLCNARQAPPPLPRGSEQSREEIATLVRSALLCATDIEQIANFSERHSRRVVVADKTADAILALLSTAHAEGLGKGEDYGVQTHVEPQHCTGLRDFLVSVAAVPGDLEDLKYLVSNVLYARGSLAKDVRREAVIAIKTYRDILHAARSLACGKLQSSGEQPLQSEPQASAGQDALDTISRLQARQRELETERDEATYRLSVESAVLRGCNEERKAAIARVLELEEALRPFAKFAEGLDHFSGPSTPGRYEYQSSVVGVRVLRPDDFRKAAVLLSPPTLEA